MPNRHHISFTDDFLDQLRAAWTSDPEGTPTPSCYCRKLLAEALSKRISVSFDALMAKPTRKVVTEEGIAARDRCLSVMRAHRLKQREVAERVGFHTSNVCAMLKRPIMPRIKEILAAAESLAAERPAVDPKKVDRIINDLLKPKKNGIDPAVVWAQTELQGAFDRNFGNDMISILVSGNDVLVCSPLSDESFVHEAKAGDTLEATFDALTPRVSEMLWAFTAD